jgi:hypothetical protein
MTELEDPICINKRIFIGAVPVKMEESKQPIYQPP